MPTLRHKAEFYTDLLGIDYEIYIDDTDYASTENTFVVKSDGFRLQYEGEAGERYNPIIPSSVSFTMRVQNSTDEALIAAMIAAEEGRFKIKILKGGNLFWVGFVLTDITSIKDAYFPYDFEIRAIDGLTRLRSIDYNDNGTAYTGRETFLEHIFNCFDKLDFDYFHGASDSFLETVTNWYETNHNVVTGLDPLTVSNFDHTVFISVNKTTKRERFFSCYDVLENIATIWGARLYFSDGSWRFEQPGLRAGSFPEWRYDKTGSFLTYSNTSYDKTIDGTTAGARTNGGVYTYFPALDKVCITYKHLDDANLIDGLTFSSDVTPSTIDLGQVDVVDGESRFRFVGTLNYTATWYDFVNPQTFRLIYRLQIKVGDYYLRRDVLLTQGTWEYSIIYWAGTPSYFEIYTDAYYITDPINPEISDSINVSFVTPPLYVFDDTIPLDVSIKFEFAEIRNTQNTQILFSGVQTYVMGNAEFQFLSDGSKVTTSSGSTYCANNQLASTNTEKLELETVMGDGPQNGSFSKIKVLDASADWVVSSEWRINDAGSDFTIQELLIREILSGQKLPVKKYQGTVLGSITAQNKLVDGAFEYILLGGTYIAGKDEFRGTWYVIDTDYTNIGLDTPYEINEQPVIGEPGGGGGGDEPDEPYEELPGVTVHVIEGDDTDVDLPPGYIEYIQIDEAVSNTYQEGDSITLIDSNTGNSQTVLVQEDVEAGDTQIAIFTTLNYPFTAGTSIVPTGSEAVPENQKSGEIVNSFFEETAVLTDVDYYLQTTAKIPNIKNYLLLKGTANWTVTTPGEFWTVPPIYDGAIMTTFVAAKTAGTGSGNNTIDILLNGSADETLNLAATEKTATGTHEFTLATGDEITFDLTAVTATTPAQGLDVSLVVTPEIAIETQKIKYKLDRVTKEDLVLWYKMNRGAMIPIGTGSLLFTAGSLDNVICGTDSSLDITGNFTLQVWVRFDAIDITSNTLAGKFTGGNGFSIARLATNTTLTVDGQSSCTFTSALMTAKKWHCITATYDGTNATIYLDGEAKQTVAYTAPTTNADEFRIGNLTTNSQEHIGNLCNIALWNEALTNDQVNSVRFKKYAELTTTEKTDLVSWWAGDDYDGTTIPDSHASNDGTVE